MLNITRISLHSTSYTLNKSYISTSTYVDIITWWDQENIGATLGRDSNNRPAVYETGLDLVKAFNTPTGEAGQGKVDGSGDGPHFRW